MAGDARGGIREWFVFRRPEVVCAKQSKTCHAMHRHASEVDQPLSKTAMKKSKNGRNSQSQDH